MHAHTAKNNKHQLLLCFYVTIATLLPPFTGSSVIPLIVYLTSNIFFTYLDLTGSPAALLKYKIQEEKGVPVSLNLYSYRFFSRACTCL